MGDCSIYMFQNNLGPKILIRRYKKPFLFSGCEKPCNNIASIPLLYRMKLPITLFMFMNMAPPFRCPVSKGRGGKCLAFRCPSSPVILPITANEEK